MKVEASAPALSKLTARPKGGNGEARQEFYADLTPWLKENGCYREGPISLDGARWVGTELGRCYHDDIRFLFFNLNDLIHDLMPRFFMSCLMSFIDTSEGLLINEHAAVGSYKKSVAAAFSEGFNRERLKK